MQEEKDKQLDADRDDRAMAIVKKIYEELTISEDLMLLTSLEGTEKAEYVKKSEAFYKQMAFRIIETMIKNKIRMSEIKYSFALLKTPIDTLESFINVIVDTKYDKALCDMYGKEDIQDITIADIEERLVANAKTNGEESNSTTCEGEGSCEA